VGGPQVVILVFVCMTLCTQTCSEVVLQIPAGTAWTKRFSSKKAGDIHEGMEGCFDMVSQWGEIRL